MKRMTAFVLALIMVLLTLPTMPALADDVRTNGPYTYELKGNGTITIIKFDWKKHSGDVYIPNMIDGYTVTAIGDMAFACDSYYNRRRSSNSVTLPEGVKTIGIRAFENANISAINIPNSVQVIGAGAFHGNPACQFKLAPNHATFAVIEAGLYHKGKKELISYSYLNAPNKKDYLGRYTFTITVPEGIVSIGAYALADVFTGAYSQTYRDLQVSFNGPVLVLPSTLTSIGDYAFAYTSDTKQSGYMWSAFDEIDCTLPKLKTIGNNAFYDVICFNASLVMPAVDKIGENAFFDANFTGKLANTDTSYFYLPALDFTDAPLRKIGRNAFNQPANASYKLLKPYVKGQTRDENCVILPVVNCSEIGANNPGLGMLITSPEHFSEDLTAVPTGLNPQVTALPETISTIESGAFTSVVHDFRLTYAVTDIAVDGFPKGSTFVVDPGSFAELWCSENGFGFTIEGQNDLDWLN